MEDKWIEQVYDSLQGNLIAPISGIANGWAKWMRTRM